VANLKECEIPALSNPDRPDAYDSYEYVLRMRMDRVKQSAVQELDVEWEEKRVEIERLDAETGSSLWLADLEAFRLAWVQYSLERVAISVSVATSDAKVVKKRKPTVGK
jgi:hypothetical protein